MKKIVIVGASSGIGKELTVKLANENIFILSVCRTPPEIRTGLHIPFDVRAEEELPAFEGPLDGLVYCPGSIRLKPFRSLNIQDFRDDLDINVIGAIGVIRHYLPSMVLAGNASIVLFSSVAARIGMPYHSSVAVSKAAIEGLTISLAAELAPSIRVNAIAPSLVKTPLAERLTDTEQKVLIAGNKHPMKRIGTVADIASLAAFLLSEDASWITGQILHADGGMSTLKL